MTRYSNVALKGNRNDVLGIADDEHLDTRIKYQLDYYDTF